MNNLSKNKSNVTWTEDNRLQTVADNSWFSYYQYDAAGDRTYKLTWDGRVHTVNGRREVYYIPQSATLYASPYLVATPQGYTKHYYAGAERITSQLGRGRFADVGTPVVGDSLVQAKLQAVTGNVRYPVTLTAPSSSYFSYLDTLTNRQNATLEAYWYHTDHLGSSSWITYTDGSAVQHLHYLPFGENFVDQKSNSFDGVRYTFSAKERDTETGYSYFGSRYYSSDLSIWLSVDPMVDKYPSLSPYVYCANNPVMLVDPNGEEVEIIFNKSENRLYVIDKDNYKKGLPKKYVTANEYQMNGIRDDDGNLTHNQILVIDNVFSGGEVSEDGNIVRDTEKPYEKAIPNGSYDIVDNLADTDHPEWFRLDKVDSSPYNDKDDNSGRNGFRLHLGSTSYGCVTINKSKDESQKSWNVLTNILNKTSATSVNDRRGHQWINPFSRLTRYGTLRVIGTDNLPSK